MLEKVCNKEIKRVMGHSVAELIKNVLKGEL